MSPETIDLILGAVLAGFTLKGLFTGFIRSVVSLIAVVVAWMAAGAMPALTAVFFRYLVDPASPQFPLVTRIGTFVLAFAVVQLIGFLLTGLMEKIGMGWFNKLGGLLLGAVTGVLVGCIPIFLIYSIPPLYHWAPVQQTLKESRMLSAYTPIVRRFMRPPAKPRQPIRKGDRPAFRIVTNLAE